jgi:hypothetical protein
MLKLSRVVRFLPISQFDICFSPFTTWFPGGAALSQPRIRWLQPLTTIIKLFSRMPLRNILSNLAIEVYLPKHNNTVLNRHLRY